MMDRRGRMILDRIGVKDPLFSQTAVYRFRARMIEYGVDKVRFEKTVELA